MNLLLANNNAFEKDFSELNAIQFTFKRTFFMKAFVLFLLSIVSIGTTLQAQICDAVTAQVIPMNPQPSEGNSDFYGVKVMVNVPTITEIQVQGYIHNVASISDGMPFQLTIYPGSMEAQTATDFFQIERGTQVVTTIASVWPCPSPEETLNSVGQLHNYFMDYVFNYIEYQNLDFRDTSDLKSVVATKQQEFLASYNINPTTPYEIYIRPDNSPGIGYSASNYSNEGADILGDLQNLINEFDGSDTTSFFASLDLLQERALNLANQNEIYTIGIPVAIAKYSFRYWLANAETWGDIFLEQDSLRNSSLPISFESKFFDFFENTRATGGPNADAFNAFTKGYYFGNWYPDWKKAGTMDVAGAVRGAIFGSWGGPAGTLAGASAAALTSSTINVASQILGNLTGWW